MAYLSRHPPASARPCEKNRDESRGQRARLTPPRLNLWITPLPHLISKGPRQGDLTLLHSPRFSKLDACVAPSHSPGGVTLLLADARGGAAAELPGGAG